MFDPASPGIQSREIVAQDGREPPASIQEKAGMAEPSGADAKKHSEALVRPREVLLMRRGLPSGCFESKGLGMPLAMLLVSFSITRDQV
jgi:hypothetical protein